MSIPGQGKDSRAVGEQPLDRCWSYDPDRDGSDDGWHDGVMEEVREAELHDARLQYGVAKDLLGQAGGHRRRMRPESPYRPGVESQVRESIEAMRRLKSEWGAELAR